jgi:hypothetical protein
MFSDALKAIGLEAASRDVSLTLEDALALGPGQTALVRRSFPILRV